MSSHVVRQMIHHVSLVMWTIWIIFGPQLRKEIFALELFLLGVVKPHFTLDILQELSNVYSQHPSKHIAYPE